MGKKRRVINKDTKLKIALEAVQERGTVQELASKYQITPGMVSAWKKKLLQRDLSSFEESKLLKKTEKALEEAKEKNDFITTAYGKSQLELELLKKKMSLSV
jgi:putative transposase